MSDYTLSVDLTADSAQFNQAMDTAREKFRRADDAVAGLGDKLKSVGGKLQGFGAKMSVGLTLPIQLAGGAMIKAASDYDENLNKVNVAFGKSADAVTAWSNNAIKQFGLSKNQAMEATSLFGDMATSMGMAQGPASEMSMSLAGLAGDMASFKNVSIDEAMTALNGVFTGETESLKRMGVVMTEANLAAYALAQGISKPIDQMTQAEKVQLRYNYVMEMTKNAQGDYARTSDGTANSMRTFKGAVDNLFIALGQNLLPIFTPIVQKLTEMVDKFATADPWVQKLVLGMAGAVAAIGPLSLVIGTVVKGVGGLMTAGNALIPILGGTGTGFKALGMAARAFLAPIAPIILGVTALVAGLTYLWNTNEQFRNSMLLAGQQIMAAVMPVVQQLAALFQQVAQAVAPIAVQVAEMIGKILTAIAPLIVVFAQVFGEVLSIVITIFSKILGAITGVFGKITKAWTGLKDFVGGVFNGIESSVKALVNTVEGFVNNVIGGINFAIKLINKIPGVEIGLIPKLATGTDNWPGGPAMINEQGGEIVNLPRGAQVIPHDLSKKYLQKSAAAVKTGADMDYERMGEAVADAIGRVTLRNIVTINGRVLADELAPAIDKKLGIAQILRRRGV